ncbi:hypothetical protein M885DRAFT_286436 [Pelagophyceae sp. CCMP2097]|nr:hypothetical protein M885DRAFT_286436 [Pelagophyceae sp. CCMP2097]
MESGVTQHGVGAGVRGDVDGGVVGAAAPEAGDALTYDYKMRRPKRPHPTKFFHDSDFLDGEVARADALRRYRAAEPFVQETKESVEEPKPAVDKPTVDKPAVEAPGKKVSPVPEEDAVEFHDGRRVAAASRAQKAYLVVALLGGVVFAFAVEFNNRTRFAVLIIPVWIGCILFLVGSAGAWAAAAGDSNGDARVKPSGGAPVSAEGAQSDAPSRLLDLAETEAGAATTPSSKGVFTLYYSGASSHSSAFLYWPMPPSARTLAGRSEKRRRTAMTRPTATAAVVARGSSAGPCSAWATPCLSSAL